MIGFEWVMFWEAGECDEIVAVEWVGGWFGFVKEDGRIKNQESREEKILATDYTDLRIVERGR